jgi:UDP-glucuronate 4-epimerase
MKILLTGCAGFIGMHCALNLLKSGAQVVGIDNINDYYDVSLKRARLSTLAAYPKFEFHQLDLADLQSTQKALNGWVPHRVLHLAAQPGVRYSIDHPHVYAQANLVAFLNVLELCRHWSVEHLVYASSSSVYGGNTKLPFHEADAVDHPISLYAATKRANELMAYTYSHLYQVPTTGLRFFTVYGPWGRPDMAPFKFVKAISQGQAIDIYNHGQQMRDFTYVDDVVESTLRCLHKAPAVSIDSPVAYRIFNVGNSNPVQLGDFIQTIEAALGQTAPKNMLPAQPGDVSATYADTHALQAWTGFVPNTPLDQGIGAFVHWYKAYVAGTRYTA